MALSTPAKADAFMLSLIAPTIGVSAKFAVRVATDTLTKLASVSFSAWSVPALSTKNWIVGTPIALPCPSLATRVSLLIRFRAADVARAIAPAPPSSCVAAASAAKKAENDAAIELRDAIAAHTSLFADIQKIIDNINDNLRDRVLVAKGATYTFVLSESAFSDSRTFPEETRAPVAYRASNTVVGDDAASVRSYFPYDIAPVVSA